jgi:lipoprotein-anchoring transpeptidase ErfK/SrfK
VGGMTRTQAIQAVKPSVDSMLARTIDVEVGDHTWTVSSGDLGTTAAVEQAVDQAMSIQESFAWPSRVFHRLLHRPVHRDVRLSVSFDRGAVWKFASSVADKVARPARDASLDFTDGKLVVVHSKAGATVSKVRIRNGVLRALRDGKPAVTVKAKAVAPTVSEDNLGMTIVVRTSLEKLYLYDGVKLVKTYSVATGQPQYPTPLGHFTIINKRINPTWINPALDTWGKNEPAMIPPGPDNPLGTRALDLSVPGIRIHGTPSDSSIGHAASHGCIRMHIPDSEDLFDRVDVGTRVIIAT